METIRVRIAPSPTGTIHVGLARTALYNYLFAKQHGGTFVLRIEDTDTKRNKEGSEQNIFAAFDWLGLTYDEGPDHAGSYGPYRQSERTETYADALQKLIAAGKAYPCYCTQEELDEERTAQQNRGVAQVYSQKCRFASEEQRAAWEKEGRSSIYRFATNNEHIVFDDLIRGRVEFDMATIGDFSIARGLRDPLYNFAVVVDDALMRISHVIRGEEHLSNTPRQIVLYQALGFPLPVFAHLPLLLGDDRKKLSKRKGATSVEEYRAAGYLPQAMVNFLALLGWHPQDNDEREYFSLEELCNIFRLEDVQKSGALFDEHKLQSINEHYLRSIPAKELVTYLSPEEQVILQSLAERGVLADAIALVQERAVTLRDIVPGLQFLLALPDYDANLLPAQKDGVVRTIQALGDIRENFGSLFLSADPSITKETVITWIKERGYTNKEALWALRVAVTGQKNSPGVFETIHVLGADESLRRIDSALEKLRSLE